jgi:phage FluMu protein Com
MRLPLSRIHRAFPELDSYDDATCKVFVRRALGDLTRQVVDALILVMFYSLMLVLTIVVLSRFGRLLFGPRARPGFSDDALPVIVCISSVIGVPVVATLLLRDWRLRRRIKKILRDGSGCMRCGYALLGLEVSRHNTIRCPECGLVNVVDASLQALARAESTQTAETALPERTEAE